MIGTWEPPPGSRKLLEVEVPGKAVQAGSKRGTAIRYKNAQKKWRISTWFDKQGHQHAKVNVSDVKAKELKARAKEIHAVIEVAAEAGFEIPDSSVPLIAVCTFYRPHGKGHYGSGRNADKLKDSAPAYPITAPDLTKLWRGFEDALKEKVWADDAKVTGAILDEQFVEIWEEARTVFRLYSLPATVGELRALTDDLTLVR